MRQIFVMLGVIVFAFLNVTAYGQNHTPRMVRIGLVNIEKIQSDASFRDHMNTELHTQADNLTCKYGQQVQSGIFTRDELNTIGDQYQSQINTLSVQENAILTREIKQEIAMVAQKRGCDVVLLDASLTFSNMDEADVTFYNARPISIMSLANYGIDLTGDVIQYLNHSNPTNLPSKALDDKNPQPGDPGVYTLNGALFVKIYDVQEKNATNENLATSIEGKVKNISGQTLVTVSVDVAFYEKDKTRIAVLTDSTENLADGETWRMKVDEVEGAFSYKIIAVHGQFATK